MPNKLEDIKKLANDVNCDLHEVELYLENTKYHLNKLIQNIDQLELFSE